MSSVGFNKCSHAFNHAINVLNTLTFLQRSVLCALLLIVGESLLGMSKRYTFQIEYIDMLAMCSHTFPLYSKENLIAVSDFVNTITFRGSQRLITSTYGENRKRHRLGEHTERLMSVKKQ